MKEFLEMSKKEQDRLYIMQQLRDKKIKQKDAAKFLNISERQVRNLLVAFIQSGAKALVSKKRGQVSNRTCKTSLKKQVLALVSERYPDFGPTFTREKLIEYHNIEISEETVRKWMMEKHLWIPRQRKLSIHPSRPRRNYFGEMIQIDASHHRWFEDRAEKCALIVFIDDSTSKLTSLFFCPVECLEGYFVALRNHILKYGRPISLYSDRHAIFGGSSRIHHAQFIRALKELNIESILAGSPQAKGRVERVNRTLQDRLVKELRLRNISSIEEANHYLPEFIESHNKIFSKEPRGQFDTHRPLAPGYDLERALTRCETRTLSKDLSFSFNNTVYQILEISMINRLRNKKIEIRQKSDGTFRVFYNERELKYKPLKKCIDDRVMDCKDLLVWNEGRGGKPKPDHPWKKYAYRWELEKQLKQKKVYNME